MTLCILPSINRLDCFARDEKEADQVVTLLDTISSPESYLPVVEAARATELSQTFTISRILPDISLFVDRIVRMNHVA